MAEQLTVEIRESMGKRRNRRLRDGGDIPAVLYGHGKENVHLAVPAEQLEAAVRHGSRLVELTGGVNESAFIRDLQWDTWGQHVLHVDFTRISVDEQVEVTVPIELRGEAPGVREGGVVEQLLHELDIACPAGSIPEKIEVNVNHLQLNQSVKASELELPARAQLTIDGDDVVVQCVEPVEVPEEEEAEAAGAEPEVIGGKPDEGEGEQEGD